jgi:hypothetical protein
VEKSLRQLSPLEKYRGELLAYFLNRGLVEHPEIGQILQSCQELHTLYTHRPAPLPSSERRAYELKQRSLASKINEALRRFEIVLGLEVSELGLSIVSFLAHPVSPAKHKAVIAQFTKSGVRAFGPHTAVQVILEMTGAGSIDRIRQCENPNCRKWLMVTNTKRVTCSDDCRFAKYQMKKDSRANDMWKSRELHKNHPHVKRQSSVRPAMTAKRKRGKL